MQGWACFTASLPYTIEEYVARQPREETILDDEIARRGAGKTHSADGERLGGGAWRELFEGGRVGQGCAARDDGAQQQNNDEDRVSLLRIRYSSLR